MQQIKIFKTEAARRATSTKRDNVKLNVNKVNVKVNVNKVNVKVNVNKVNDKLNDIYSIHSHYKGGGRWPPPQKSYPAKSYPSQSFHNPWCEKIALPNPENINYDCQRL